jgi:CBS domain-containing protein
MRVREIMSQHPVVCCLQDTAQTVASMLREKNIGCVPVIVDRDSERLIGIITDRDLCCGVLAQGLDPRTTVIESFVTRDPVTCRAEQSVDSCARLMQMRQIRRIVVVDGNGHCIGMVSQADLARSVPADGVQKTVSEISRPGRIMIAPAAA